MDLLKEQREKLDLLDSELISILAKRFNITQEVGQIKKQNKLPATDQVREKNQMQLIRQKAIKVGLPPEIAEKVLRLIINEVVKNHKQL